MSDNDIEKIAELVFQKLLAKQEEWDKHFHYASNNQVLIDKISALNIIKDKYVIDEEYELAKEIADKIKTLTNELNKNNTDE